MSLTDTSLTASYTSSALSVAAVSAPPADPWWGAQLKVQSFYFLITGGSAVYNEGGVYISLVLERVLVLCWYAQIILLLGPYISSRLRTIQHILKVCSARSVTKTLITHLWDINPTTFAKHHPTPTSHSSTLIPAHHSSVHIITPPLLTSSPLTNLSQCFESSKQNKTMQQRRLSFPST